MTTIAVDTLRGWLEEQQPCPPKTRLRRMVHYATRATFVRTTLARIPPTPPNYQRIVRLNEAGVLPDSGLTELEAGANRCAIA